MVFMSAPNFPMTTIVPTYTVAGMSDPICIALTQCGGGHYDAVMRGPDSFSDSETPAQEDKLHCTYERRPTKVCHVLI